MPTLIAGAAVIVLYSLLRMSRPANPAVLARAVKLSGGSLRRRWTQGAATAFAP